MYRTRDFAGGIKPRNHLARAVENACVALDANAAHRVVARHADRAGKEGRLVDLVREHARGAPERIFFAVDHGVVFGDGLFERLGGHADLFRQFVERCRFKEHVVLQCGGVRIALELVVFGEAFAVGQRINGLRRLCERRGANDVAARVFGDEALAFFVDEDRVFDHLNEVAFGRVARRIARNALDVVEARRHRADVLHGEEHFARCALLVRGRELFKTRVEPGAELGVVGVAARRRNDALLRGPVFLAVLRFDFNTENAALVGRLANDGSFFWRLPNTRIQCRSRAAFRTEEFSELSVRDVLEKSPTKSHSSAAKLFQLLFAARPSPAVRCSAGGPSASGTSRVFLRLRNR